MLKTQADEGVRAPSGNIAFQQFSRSQPSLKSVCSSANPAKETN